jgi:hypothetical protein
MYKCYEMLEFGRYRYNMFKPEDDWFEGQFATEENLERIDLSKVPEGVPLLDMLAETHAALYRPKPT